MTLKIIHTADWHLGHILHRFDREVEHQAFLDWLIELIKTEQADALLVAGDIFDTANPSAASWHMLYGFLAKLNKEMPRLDIILLGGNHDSPSKLNAPHDLLKVFNLHMLGSVQRSSEGQLDFNSLLVPIHNKANEIAAWVMAVPFLRNNDLRIQGIDETQDRLIVGVKQLYQEVYDVAKQRIEVGQALIATGHLYMMSTSLSELSEKKILGGNQHALPASIFQDDIDYVALGHLHLAQEVAKQDRIRYSGSPIPLSITERHYKHQVLSVEFEKGALSKIAPHLVPRSVELLRMPKTALSLTDTLALLEQWQPEKREIHYQPIVDIPVLLDEPDPLLREKIHRVLEGKPVRLASISPQYLRVEHQQSIQIKTLDEVTPTQIFTHHWQNQYAGDVPKHMQDAFTKLQEDVEQNQEDKA